MLGNRWLPRLTELLEDGDRAYLSSVCGGRETIRHPLKTSFQPFIIMISPENMAQQIHSVPCEFDSIWLGNTSAALLQHLFTQLS